jgi:hypothetical protein
MEQRKEFFCEESNGYQLNRSMCFLWREGREVHCFEVFAARQIYVVGDQDTGKSEGNQRGFGRNTAGKEQAEPGWGEVSEEGSYPAIPTRKPCVNVPS